MKKEIMNKIIWDMYWILYEIWREYDNLEQEISYEDYKNKILKIIIEEAIIMLVEDERDNLAKIDSTN